MCSTVPLGSRLHSRTRRGMQLPGLMWPGRMRRGRRSPGATWLGQMWPGRRSPTAPLPGATLPGAMSAVPESLPAGVIVDAPPPARGTPVGRNVLPRKARIYLAVLALLTVASAGTFYLRAPEIRNGWVTFVVLAAAATVAQIFP